MATRIKQVFQARLNLEGGGYEVISSGHRTKQSALRNGSRILRGIATSREDAKGMIARLEAVPFPDPAAFQSPAAPRSEEEWWAEVTQTPSNLVLP